MKSIEIDRGKRLQAQTNTGHNRFHQADNFRDGVGPDVGLAPVQGVAPMSVSLVKVRHRTNGVEIQDACVDRAYRERKMFDRGRNSTGG